MTQSALPFVLLDARPCGNSGCPEMSLPAVKERWWPFHSVMVVCPTHGEQWWLLGPGDYSRAGL